MKTDITAPVVRNRLDPLYEAYLLERLQFDGDAPELRFGPMPKGATPAVPVDTNALNPVAVGWMLEQASSEVQAEMNLLQSELCTALAVSGSSDLISVDVPDPVGYERGSLPALRKMSDPTGLLFLETDQQKQLAWKALSTTQGRRSMIAAIRNLIASGLCKAQYDVEVVDGMTAKVSPDLILAYAEWTVDIVGPNTSQASFSFADVAWKSLLKKLMLEVPPINNPVTLEVSTVNTVDIRKVGFCARLIKR